MSAKVSLDLFGVRADDRTGIPDGNTGDVHLVEPAMCYWDGLEVGNGQAIDALVSSCRDFVPVEAVPVVLRAARENPVSLGDGLVVG